MAQITKRDGSRWYTHPIPCGNCDGKGTNAEGTCRECGGTGLVTGRFWSVTTIIDNGIPKKALMEWGPKFVAEFAVDNLDIVKTMVERDQKNEAVDYLKNSRYATTNRAKDVGSKVHEAIEAYMLERPYPGVPVKAADYYKPFLVLLKEHRPFFLQTEARVYNIERRYAGTLDNIAVWASLAEATNPKTGALYFPKRCHGPTGCGQTEPEGHANDCTAVADQRLEKGKASPSLFRWGDPRGPVLVGDVKTGKGPKKGGVYSEVGLQLAAYANAEFIAGPEGSRNPLPEIDGAVAIHLQPGWAELLPIRIGPEVLRAFLYAREIVVWQDETSKGVVGWPPLVEVNAEPEPEAVEQLDTAEAVADKAIDAATAEVKGVESNGGTDTEQTKGDDAKDTPKEKATTSKAAKEGAKK